MTRIDKVNQRVKREIGLILQQELRDPRLQFVSVTHVDVSKDLRHAKVFFMVLNPEEQMEAAHNGLDAAKGRIRGLISKRVNMRYTPELNFYYDNSIESVIRIEETLTEIKNANEEDHTDNP